MNVKRDKDLKSDPNREEYNWLNTIKFHIIKSIILSLASIIFISFSYLHFYFITSQFPVGLAFIFFLSSAEIYISAKNHDLFSISNDQYEFLKKENKMSDTDWEELKYKQLNLCKKKVKRAHIIYKIGLLFFFIGFFSPFGDSIFIFFAGIGFIIWLFIK